MDLICFISRREGEKLIWLGTNHNLTKQAVMAMTKIKKNGSITWGGWIHAFYSLKWIKPAGGRPTMILKRYDAYND